MGSPARPIFCSESELELGNMSLVRHQVPITPAWAITEYKAQGSTYDKISVDLHRKSSGASHKRYTSVYVQLSRARSLEGLSLLQNVTLGDLQGRIDPELVTENRRLAKLAYSTDFAWKQIESNPRFQQSQIN
jgi:hypothetical protein